MLVLYIGLRAKIVFEFENFLSNFEKVLIDNTLCNFLFTIILGDFNARTSVWWTRDKASVEGTQLESLIQVCMGFINQYHNALIYYHKPLPLLI